MKLVEPRAALAATPRVSVKVPDVVPGVSIRQPVTPAAPEQADVPILEEKSQVSDTPVGRFGLVVSDSTPAVVLSTIQILVKPVSVMLI